ncbi:MAG: extracellular solute-binding protein [Lachnospiraceae bacterium]|nr:extracellular solute-binding protein [Lachnospiraceae bacterium]
MKRVFALFVTALLFTTGLFACTGARNPGTIALSSGEGDSLPKPVEAVPIAPVADDTPVKEISPVRLVFTHALTGDAADLLYALTLRFNEENVYGITVVLPEDPDDSADGTDEETVFAAEEENDDGFDSRADIQLLLPSVMLDHLEDITMLDTYAQEDTSFSYDDIIAPFREYNESFRCMAGLPFTMSTDVYYYNKNLFEDYEITPPSTWQELTAAGSVVLDQRDIPVVAVRGAGTYFEIMCIQNGTRFVDSDGIHFDDGAGAGKEAVRFLTNMHRLGYLRLTYEESERASDFRSQRTAGFIGSSLAAPEVFTAGFDVGVIPLPAGRVQGASAVSGSFLVITAGDGNARMAAWEYLKYLTGTHVNALWAVGTGYLPVRYSAFETPEYRSLMETDPVANACHAQIDDMFVPYDIENDPYAASLALCLSQQLLNGAEAAEAYDALIDEAYNSAPQR